MIVTCPKCSQVFSIITESNEPKMVHRDVKCLCGNVYPIEYPSLSRHQFNPDALDKCIDRDSLNVMKG